MQFGELSLLTLILQKEWILENQGVKGLIKHLTNLGNNTNVAIAAAVTAHSRMIINQYKLEALKLGLNLFYSDTDSLVLDGALPENVIHSSTLGKLKLEHIFKEGIFVMPKVYYLELEDGEQRAYYLLVYHTLKGYSHFKRCNYSTELEFNNAIIEYFRYNPSTYFSFNGKNFDHLLLNKILRQSGTIPLIWREKSSVRKMNWLGNTFLETLYWTHPCSLRDLAKTFLREDLKDKFPHDAVSPDMIISPNSRFKELRKEDFKGFTDLDILKFSNKEFWPLVEEYILKDVQILHRSLLELDELYRKEIEYSITDRNYHGIASISYDFVLKFIEKGDLVPFTREQQEKWKSCLMGGIVEVLDLNLKQETVHKYDINGLYSHVRLKDGFDYPIGEPELIVNPSVDRLKDLFGLIKATVYNDGSVPIGIPAKDGASFKIYAFSGSFSLTFSFKWS